MFLGPLHAATLQIRLKVFFPMPDVFATHFNLDVTKCLAIVGLQHSFSFAWLKIKSIRAFVYQSWAAIPPASSLIPRVHGSLAYLFPDKKAFVVEMLKITNVSSCLE